MKKKNLLIMIGSALVLLGAVAAIFYTSQKPDVEPKSNAVAQSTPTLTTNSSAKTNLIETGDDGRRLGDAKAPIVIIEYSSLTCPHCADFTLNVLPEIKKNWIDTGKAQLIYRDFPWDQQALMAASLARCVAPTKFFPFLDLLFREQASWVRPGETKPNFDSLVRFAKLAGLGEDKAKSCLEDKKLQTDAVTQRTHGQNLFKVDSTPWVMLNGVRTTAYVSTKDFDAALKKLSP